MNSSSKWSKCVEKGSHLNQQYIEITRHPRQNYLNVNNMSFQLRILTSFAMKWIAHRNGQNAWRIGGHINQQYIEITRHPRQNYLNVNNMSFQLRILTSFAMKWIAHRNGQNAWRIGGHINQQYIEITRHPRQNYLNVNNMSFQLRILTSFAMKWIAHRNGQNAWRRARI